MALFDQVDITTRLLSYLPAPWFSDAAKADGGNLFALLYGIAGGDADIYARVQALKANGRILTTQDVGQLALMSSDFFGNALPPLSSETASQYRARILARLFIPGGTREGIRRSVFNITGKSPTIIEPWNPTDTGGWDTFNCAWDTAGALGDQALTYTAFVRLQRPSSVASGAQPYYGAWDGQAGWDTSLLYYADLASAQVIPDATLYGAVNLSRPAAVTVWTQIN